MRKNKITALVLVCVMMFSIMATGFVMAAEEEIMPISESTSKFEDISGHWAEQTIINMTENGIVKGQTPTLFAPDANVTNAEFIALCVRVANKEVTPGSGSFTDVTEGNWYYEEVEKAVALGIIEAGGEFKPNEPMSREDMAVAAYKTYGEDVEAAELDFTDVDEISADKAELVAKAVTVGLIEGMDTGAFLPKDNMTRAQSATVIERLMELISEEPTVTPSAEPTELPEIGCFPNEDWVKSGIVGPELDTGLEKIPTETAYTDKTGASAIYYPGIEREGNINIYVYLIPQGEKDDTQMKVEVYHNGKVDETIIDTSKEKEGYYYIGWYDFAGSSKEYEYVKVTRISEDDTYTRLSMIRFDFLAMTSSENPDFNEHSPVNGQYFVAPYYKKADVEPSPSTAPTTEPTGDVTEETETSLKNPEEWNLTFADYFDGTALNEEVWKAADKDAASHTLCSRWKENVEVKDGNLYLYAKKEVRPIELADGTIHEQPFTCGSISTLANDWHYGYYEAKYKYAAATGTNNSFWLMAPNVSEVGNSEIDINEGHYPYEMATNIHGFDPNQGGRVTASMKYQISAPQDLATEMNIFHLEWDAKQLQFGCNGEIVRKAENKYCKNPVRMYLSLAVLDFAGEVTDAIDGTEMVVDWVKVYEKK